MTTLTRHLEEKQVGDVTVVTLTDEKILADHSETLPNLIGSMFNALIKEGKIKMVLNLELVRYLDETMVGKIIGLHRKIKALNGALVLCNIAEEILSVMQTNRLDRFFAIQKDEESALKLFVLAR